MGSWFSFVVLRRMCVNDRIQQRDFYRKCLFVTVKRAASAIFVGNPLHNINAVAVRELILFCSGNPVPADRHLSADRVGNLNDSVVAGGGYHCGDIGILLGQTRFYRVVVGIRQKPADIGGSYGLQLLQRAVKCKINMMGFGGFAFGMYDEIGRFVACGYLIAAQWRYLRVVYRRSGGGKPNRRQRRRERAVRRPRQGKRS